MERRRPRQHRRHPLVDSGTSRESCDLPRSCRTQRPRRRDNRSFSSTTPQDQPTRSRRLRVHGRLPPTRLQSALWKAAPWRQSKRPVPYTPPRCNRRHGQGRPEAVRTRNALGSSGHRPGGVCGRTARRTAPTRRNGRRRACKTRKPRRDRDATTEKTWRSWRTWRIRSSWCSSSDANVKKSWRSWRSRSSWCSSSAPRRSWRSRSSSAATPTTQPPTQPCNTTAVTRYRDSSATKL